MIRRFGVLLALAMALCVAGFAQEHEHPIPAKNKTATLMTGLGDWRHPVSTKNAQAQAFFDQGLRLIYAFNHDEAARSFQRSAELDPKLAMAYWGIAEAVGPNYNDPASEDRFVQAHQAIEKAASLAEDSSESDRAYIVALTKRFPADPKSDFRAAAEEYRDAMREVSKKFPDDLDAATLFAEAGMNLHPWGLWHIDGSPEEGTEEIVATLESVIRREPNHLGAIHYYIHAVEASRSPERALAGANRLAQLAPAAGHIVHMPAHIYIRTGDYEAAVKTNQKAAQADQAYLAASKAQGIYPMMYYSHNLHFIAMAAAMNGNYVESRHGAQMLAANVGPHVKEMPPLEGFMTVPLAVEVRFHKWNEILKAPRPDASMQTATVFWHFARGLALASTGKLEEAEAQHKLVAEAEEKTPPDAIFQMPINNKTKDILKIAENVLGAKISQAKEDSEAAIRQLRVAVAIQDGLKYNEPQDWFYPVRESLGATLLISGDQVGAEQVFRDDLERNPRNPRSLFGLEQALKAQGRTYDATFVRKQFDASWKGTAAPKMEDLV
ncbi:MAG: Tetratricopeptide repeat protein [Candidatus Acidoferrum typicum]|nr:Tetratricopeptide repeat protein [Candidatus Acidoferrum typicum]